MPGSPLRPSPLRPSPFRPGSPWLPLLPLLSAGAGVLVFGLLGILGAGALVAAGLVGLAGLLGLLLRPPTRAPAPTPAPAEPDPEPLGDRVPLPLFLLADDSTVSFANPAAESQFGAGIVGAPVARAIRDPDFLAALAGARESGEWREVELSLGRDPERVFRVWLRPSPEPPEGAEMGPEMGAGKPLLVCLAETTEIHRSRALHRDFVANASHELRTPLATVAGCIETLRGHARDDREATEHFAGILQRETDRMRRIVADLLSLNRIEMQEHVRPTERVDAVALAREALAARPGALADGLELAAPEAPLPILASPVELLHALDNILANAERHAGGATGMEVRRRGRRVEITVRDRGPGVAAEHLARLTERFYRAEAGDRTRGTGLGLAIVKHVVTRHQGELVLQSEPGAGLDITLRFDMAEGGPEAADAAGGGG